MRKAVHIQDPEVLFHLCMLMVEAKSREEVERYLLDLQDALDATEKV